MALETLRSRIAGKELFARAAEYDSAGNKIDETIDAINEKIPASASASNQLVTTSDMSTKADKVASATSGDLATLDAYGNLADSGVASTVLTSKAAASGGTELSLVTTGEKYTWNSWTSGSVNIPPIDGVVIAGRKYEYKKFGDREWMMESLKFDTSVEQACYINQATGIYYYKADYVYNNDEFTSIIPSGWRIPTTADRNALVSLAGGETAAGATYLYNNFNVEPSSMYDGYNTYPGAYYNGWVFCILTRGNPTGGIIIRNDTTPQKLINSANNGSNGYQISVPVRLCRDAAQGG